MNRFIATTPNRCIGCRTCEVACVVAHAVEDGVERLTPTHFLPRLSTVKTINVSAPVTCHHCEDAPCVNACPTHAIAYRQSSVQVNQERCIGCKTCMVVCPFGAMKVIAVPATKVFAGIKLIDGVKAQARKCDLCTGRDAGPACVSACLTNALKVADDTEIDALLQQRRMRSASELVGEAPSL